MSESNLPSDRDLEARAKQAFDRSVEEIDAATRSRLTQARYRALQELSPARAGRPVWGRFAPAGALAVVALVTVLVFWQPAIEPSLQVAAAADFEILLGEEELEMLEELEFYAWLEEQPEFASPGDAEPNAAGDGVG